MMEVAEKKLFSIFNFEIHSSFKCHRGATPTTIIIVITQPGTQQPYWWEPNTLNGESVEMMQIALVWKVFKHIQHDNVC